MREERARACVCLPQQGSRRSQEGENAVAWAGYIKREVLELELELELDLDGLPVRWPEVRNTDVFRDWFLLVDCKNWRRTCNSQVMPHRLSVACGKFMR